MVKYGSVHQMQDLAWGGSKTTTPKKVKAVQLVVTALINNVLNRSEEYSTVPNAVNRVANIVGSEILRPGGEKLSTIQIIDMLKVLLSDYMNNAPAGETNWGNVRWV